MRYNADISPAIRELKKLHLALLDEASKKEGITTHAGFVAARDTVISVVPGERRRELGWYKWRMWEKKTDAMLHQLDPSYKAGKYHEIFVAGEALAGKPSDLVWLMMHQVCHQAAGVASIRSYHGEWMKHWMQRLYGVPQEAFIREPILGWVSIDHTKVSPEAKKLVAKLSKRIKVENIDLFRDKKTKYETTGKMLLWYCDGCKRPPRIRTGAMLRNTCDMCGGKVLFRDYGKVTLEWLQRLGPEYRDEAHQ